MYYFSDYFRTQNYDDDFGDSIVWKQETDKWLRCSVFFCLDSCFYAVILLISQVYSQQLPNHLRYPFLKPPYEILSGQLSSS